MKYFEVVVAVKIGESKSGKAKINKEIFLVDSLSCTEAERRVIKDFVDAKTSLEYEVTSVKESRIMSVIQ